MVSDTGILVNKFSMSNEVFANIFMCFHGKKLLEKCPDDFRPVFYKRYIDDTFILFKDKSHGPFS